jgi:hypothetical protein
LDLFASINASNKTGIIGRCGHSRVERFAANRLEKLLVQRPRLGNALRICVLVAFWNFGDFM